MWSVLHRCTETDSNSATASRSRRSAGHQRGGLPTAEQEQAENRTVSQRQQSSNGTVALHQHLQKEPSTPSADHLLRDCGSALGREENPDLPQEHNVYGLYGAESLKTTPDFNHRVIKKCASQG